MKKVLLIIGTLVAFGLLMRLCSTNEKLNEKFVDSTTAISETKSNVATVDSAVVATKWDYSEDVDKMSNKVNYFATILSESPVALNFPYDKGSYGSLTIRKMDGRLGAVLTVNGSQFSNADVYGGTVMIKFDEEVGRKYSYGLASDGSADFIFIENTKLLISKLKKAKTMLIEAEFYNNGNKIMEFDVKDFEWKH